MWKYAVGGVIAATAVGGLAGLYFFRPTSLVINQPPLSQPVQAATSTYATTTFSIVYPADLAMNEAYAYDQFGPKKLIRGVKFTIPLDMATGTNLSAYDTGISIEQLPRARNCTGDIFINVDVKTHSVTENSILYSVASTSGATAGDLYEEQVYALSGTHPCTAVRYFIHSTNIGNYPPGTVREFDRTALLATFDGIRHALTLESPAM
ncbi:hypothetical protein HY413_03730 [Candidatus Kaiserbacteria bacterium]|nr:hypothetical protein [Candidatus Kaiserbacteria bacterium]